MAKSEHVGRRLAAWREYRGLSLEAVGLAAGITKQAVGHVEGGVNDISVGKLERICSKALRTDLVTFFGPLPGRDAA